MILTKLYLSYRSVDLFINKRFMDKRKIHQYLSDQRTPNLRITLETYWFVRIIFIQNYNSGFQTSRYKRASGILHPEAFTHGGTQWSLFCKQNMENKKICMCESGLIFCVCWESTEGVSHQLKIYCAIVLVFNFFYLQYRREFIKKILVRYLPRDCTGNASLGIK